MVEDRGDLSGQPRSSQPEVDFADSGEPEAGPENILKENQEISEGFKGIRRDLSRLRVPNLDSY